MAIKIMDAVWEMTCVRPVQKLILLDLADTANEAGVCWPSINRIATRTGCSRSTVCEALKEFEDRGILTRQPRFENGKQVSTVYTIVSAGVVRQPDGGVVRQPDGGSPPAGPTQSASRTGVVRQPDTEPSGEPSKEPSMNKSGAAPRGSSTPESLAVPGLNAQAFEEWLAYKRRIGKPYVSPQTVLAQARKLAGFGSSQAAVVQQSIDNGWQGLFAVKVTTASARRQNDARVWDPDREQYVDASTLKPWQLEKLNRVNEAQDAFETGAVNA